jgi:hypothetical protein
VCIGAVRGEAVDHVEGVAVGRDVS